MNRSLRVLDGLIQNISSVRTVSEDTAINVAINKLISNMSTDDMYRKALEDVKIYRRIAEEATQNVMICLDSYPWVPMDISIVY